MAATNYVSYGNAEGLMMAIKAAIDNAEYTLPKASSSTLGGIKVGSRLSIDNDGVLSADSQAYTLPTANASTLGGVKVGSNLSIDGSGVLSADAQSAELTTAQVNALIALLS